MTFININSSLNYTEIISNLKHHSMSTHIALTQILTVDISLYLLHLFFFLPLSLPPSLFLYLPSSCSLSLLSVCMSICMCVYVCMYIYLLMYIHMCVHTHTYTFVLFTFIYIYIHIYIIFQLSLVFF